MRWLTENSKCLNDSLGPWVEIWVKHVCITYEYTGVQTETGRRGCCDDDCGIFHEDKTVSARLCCGESMLETQKVD